jgi:FixJ family two-component response regulator
MSPFVNKPTIYIVDDDDAVRNSLNVYLSLKGLDVRDFGSAQELLECSEDIPNLVILDINMPNMDGFKLMGLLKEREPALPIILITGLGDPAVRARAEQAGAVAFIDKPIDTPVLYQIVTQVLSGLPN